MAAVTISGDFGAQENKVCHFFHFFPFYSILLLFMFCHICIFYLGKDFFLEKEMATLSSIFPWKIPWTEEPSGLHSPWGHKKSDTTE